MPAILACCTRGFPTCDPSNKPAGKIILILFFFFFFCYTILKEEEYFRNRWRVKDQRDKLNISALSFIQSFHLFHNIFGGGGSDINEFFYILKDYLKGRRLGDAAEGSEMESERVYSPSLGGDANYSSSCEQFVQPIFNSPGAHGYLHL